MKTLLRVFVLLPILLLLPVVSSAEHLPFKPCCAGGASPWASESPDTVKANPNAGFIGSELPPSSGYNPDHIDKYTNPANSIYNHRQPSPAPSAGASETPPVNSESYQQRYGGAPEGTWRGF